MRYNARKCTDLHDCIDIYALRRKTNGAILQTYFIKNLLSALRYARMALRNTKDKGNTAMTSVKKTMCTLFAALIAVLFMWNAFTANVMEQFVRLHRFSDFACAFFRWIQLAGFVFIFPALLWNERRCAFLAFAAALPATVGALAFSGNFFAVHKVNGAEIAAYILMNASMLAACILCAFLYFEKKDRAPAIGKKSTIILFVCVLIGVIPLNVFMQIPALMDCSFLKFVRFGGWHFLFVGIAVAAAVLAGLYLKRLSKEERYAAVFILSLVLFCHLALRFSFVRLRAYHSTQGILSALPLYVCSFGIFLLPFAVATRSSFFQGILFLINAPGAIVAFIWPSCGPVTIFHYNVTYFVVSHILLFVTTAQLASALGGVPTIKHIKHLSYLIAAYYVTMFVLNTVAQAISGKNPNFSYVSFSPLPVSIHFFLAIKIGKSTLSLPYLLILCAVQYALCFVTFGIWKLFGLIASRLHLKRLRDPLAVQLADSSVTSEGEICPSGNGQTQTETPTQCGKDELPASEIAVADQETAPSDREDAPADRNGEEKKDLPPKE